MEENKAKIILNVNNGRKLELLQEEQDGSIFISTYNHKGELEEARAINAGDFVQLLNLYTWTIENDIKNSFINPYGANKEE